MKKTIATAAKYLPYVIPVLSFGVLIFLLNQTNPLDAGPSGVLLIFWVVYIVISSTLYLLLNLLLIAYAYFFTIHLHSRKKVYYLTSILALGPVFLLALNSIGQLEIKDFVLVFCLVILAGFYVIKRT